MKDRLGRKLLEWRILKVLPHLRGRLLDIGCGTNRLVAAYPGDGIGVDVFPWEGVDLVVKNTADLPYEDGEFDTVSIIASLNHIPNREEVLVEAHRILNNEGQIIITMIPPVISRIWHKLREPWDIDQTKRGMKEGEVFGITDMDIVRLLDNAGFETVHQTTFMMGINHLNVARKVILS